MREFTPWLGVCHLRQLADDSPDTQPTLAAVWADSVESFEREMHVHTNSHGQQMTWAEQVMPADEWLAKHPARKDGQRLVGKISAKHLVALGGFGAGTTGIGENGKPDGDTDGYLHIEEIEGVEPLDMQFGVHPPKTVPDALYEPLFGQPDPSAAEMAQYGGADKVPPLNTYAILDAAKVVNFVEMLEASGLEHRCLFKGEAAQEMRDVAPYVVRLKEDVDFTRNLFSKDPEQEVPWFMWDCEPGIYVRSRGSLDDMWKHFRKFTKVQDENGKWFYFRFWEGAFFTDAVRFETDFIHPLFSKPLEDEAIIAIFNNRAEVWRKNPLCEKKSADTIVIRERDQPLFRKAHIRSVRIRCKAILLSSGFVTTEAYKFRSNELLSLSLGVWGKYKFLHIESLFYIVLMIAVQMFDKEKHREDVWEKVKNVQTEIDFVVQARLYIKKTATKIYEVI